MRRLQALLKESLRPKSCALSLDATLARENMSTTPEAIERKVVAIETEVERVKKQVEDAIGDRDLELLLRQELAALRQEKVLLMQQQAAAAAAAATAAANQALGRNTFNSRMVTMEENIDEKLEQMKQQIHEQSKQIDEQSKQIAALQQEGFVQFGHLKVH
ncbi:hypothetical protein OEZ86_013953 [Tetradesmus obliquus]|nr:hypothetical protein OEZ86_013953 [Tetradesmus obliquus]